MHTLASVCGAFMNAGTVPKATQVLTQAAFAITVCLNPVITATSQLLKQRTKLDPKCFCGQAELPWHVAGTHTYITGMLDPTEEMHEAH